jgi:hypothetical protein
MASDKTKKIAGKNCMSECITVPISIQRCQGSISSSAILYTETGQIIKMYFPVLRNLSIFTVQVGTYFIINIWSLLVFRLKKQPKRHSKYESSERLTLETASFIISSAKELSYQNN